MSVKVVDLISRAHAGSSRLPPGGMLWELMMDGPRFHAWLHVYPDSGQGDSMHCHNADETFYVVEGECTMGFPDGTHDVLTAGMIALIPGGSFYDLKNTGSGQLILLGNRAKSNTEVRTINHETKEEVVWAGQRKDPPRGTSILV